MSSFVGKTTIADALVASNGIISQRMAGKVRLVNQETFYYQIHTAFDVISGMMTSLFSD